MELIYRSELLCRLVNRLLYGRHADARYQVIADLIPSGATVVDLCCGPATLFRRHLHRKSVHYTGLDLSQVFVDRLNKKGGHGVRWDVRSDKPLPEADYIVIQGALYFFLPDPSTLLDRMQRAARRAFIVAEPIRNLSDSRIPLIGNISRHLAGAVQGEHGVRFTEESLDRLFDRYPTGEKRSFKIPGGRDKVYIVEKSGSSATLIDEIP